ncbi:hypothetical protein MBLNU230_g2838t1 [Neophaeotheca triangularis]
MIASRRGRQVAFPLLKPMSTVRETAIDSPTVPGPIFFSPRLPEESGHNRSSSAPGQYGRVDTNKGWTPTLPTVSPSSPLDDTYTGDLTSIINGLGLTFEEPSPPVQRTFSKRAKPNLSIKVRDSRPPPPPKSPKQHRKNVSAEPTLSPHAMATTSQVMKFDQLQHASGPQSAPSIPSAGLGEDGSYFPSKTDARIREVANRIENGSGGTSRSQHLQHGMSGENTKDMLLPSTTYEGDGARKQEVHRRPSHASSGSTHIVHQHSRLHSERRFLTHSKDSTEAPHPPPLKDSWLRPTRKDEDMPQPLIINRSASRSQSRDAKSEATDDTPRKNIHINDSCTSEACKTAVHKRTPTPNIGDLCGQPNNIRDTSSEATSAFPTEQPSVGKTLSAEKLGNPAQTLKELSKQSAALQARYKDLRTERQQVSTGLLASLKDERPSPEYVNVLLDQQLSLAAITSAMDVCFARLNALDCRKEEAINALIGQYSATPESMKPQTTLQAPKPKETGRSTPDSAGRKLGRFGSILHKERLQNNQRQPANIPARAHSIRREVAVVDPPRSDSPMSLGGEEREQQPTKGTAAAKTLTPPIHSPRTDRNSGRNSPMPGGPQRRPSRLHSKPASEPPSRPLPTPPPPRTGLHEPTHRSAISSVSSSSENEIKTPTEEYTAPRLGPPAPPKDASEERKPSIVQAIEVVIDDDLLELYNGYARTSHGTS